MIAAAQTPTPAPTRGPHRAYAETVQVIATRIPETSTGPGLDHRVIVADELRARGADRPRARSLSPGVRSPPAATAARPLGAPSSGACASSTPSCWWSTACPGAAPSIRPLATLDLKDIERIEILRGPAPVMYGATSFVGVIHVVHNAAGGGPAQLAAPAAATERRRGALTHPAAGVGDYD